MPTKTVDPDERTIQVARKRFARRQWARRWLAWRVVLAVLALAGLVAGVVWTVFFSSVLAVSGVQIAGAGVLDPREVRRVAAVPTGSPLATVDLGAVAARVERLTPVLDADVSRSWPDRVRIDLTERTAVAVVIRDGVVQGVDDEGVIFRRYPSRPPSLPLIRMGANTQTDALAEAALVIDALPDGLAGRVAYLSAYTVDTISLRLRNGKVVRWGSAEDTADKAKVLAVLLDQPASLYDVSVPGQPVIRR
ncbi:MAG TPA: FtsQ-type POTRA domain-containing protein [Nocardioides sp.]|uniref:cell division protein FtsQ/DivIB n=1 Tax=Nocardioides sp. TaxID=35761 RepID=UPI002D7FA690|nr:FtsQ-type POTRA domain-containing protein [Nocardioides sp.]HET6653595.1 FtsQ-type POTRA domain-containing protein [Nocardioides sp.]